MISCTEKSNAVILMIAYLRSTSYCYCDQKTGYAIDPRYLPIALLVRLTVCTVIGSEMGEGCNLGSRL